MADFLGGLGDGFNNLVSGLGDSLGGKSQERIATQQLQNQAAAIQLLREEQSSGSTLMIVTIILSVVAIGVTIWFFMKKK